MSVSLDGTYIIYNPDKTINVTIIAPFQSTISILLSKLSVTVNGTDFEWYKVWLHDLFLFIFRTSNYRTFLFTKN
ncbi:MAG: hypothetical protein ACTSSG_12625 [Candidatus Heimdallarchaeaceae archaeon]